MMYLCRKFILKTKKELPSVGSSNAILPEMQSIDRLFTSLLALFAAKTGLLQRPLRVGSSPSNKPVFGANAPVSSS